MARYATLRTGALKPTTSVKYVKKISKFME
jgi:hypothetical protein